MRDQKRVENYKGFEIVQTLRENKHNGDYDLFTNVSGIYNNMESFAWLNKDHKIEKINKQMLYAKNAIDMLLENQINPYEELGFKYIEEKN